MLFKIDDIILAIKKEDQCPYIGKVFDVTFDDAFYERYIKTITTIFLDGVTGLAAQNKGRKRNND